MIHSFRQFDTLIVADVNSGAVHEVDEICFDIINVIDGILKGRKEDCASKQKEYFNPAEDVVIEGTVLKKLKVKVLNDLSGKYEEEDLDEAFEEIEQLISDGQLFSEDIYKDYIPLWERESQIKALCLHISHDCNLRCKYCFADTGSFGGKRINMTPEVGKAAIDFVVEASGKRKNIEIDFFGGEPLINFNTVKEIVEYARSLEKSCNKHFRFTITTNGLLLDDVKLKYINENMDNIVLSIDGRPEVNDSMRTRVDGSGCYDSILPKFIKTAEARNQEGYYVRGTFTGKNIDFSKDVLHLADLGFKQISVEPVVAQDGCGYELGQEHLAKLYEEYECLAMEYNKRYDTDEWFNFFHFMVDLKQGPCVAKRLTGCGSGHEYVAVTPDGDIYPCHQFVGNEELKMGSVFEGIKSADIQKQFKDSNVYTKEGCDVCWAKFYCSGGCPANAYNFNKDINKPYKMACDLEKKRVECSLWLYTQRNSYQEESKCDK